MDILWPRWVARIGVTRATEACFLTADPRDGAETLGCDMKALGRALKPPAAHSDFELSVGGSRLACNRSFVFWRDREGQRPTSKKTCTQAKCETELDNP